VLDVPHDHAEAIQAAYEELKADRIKPKVEVVQEEPVEEYTPISEPVATPTQDVKVGRGCEIIGGKFDFKVKVSNPTDFVITNVTVSLVAYPQDCIELGGESIKTISRIEVGGFRSPTFTLYPTKDCVQGKIVATVSYIDFRDQLHTMQVEPYLIRSVCDLLQPTKATAKEFDLLLGDLTKTDQEQSLDWNAKVLFTKAEKLLPVKNFHIIDTDEKIIGNQFIGTIRGYAVGKFTKKKVAVIFLITGAENGRHSSVKVDALGDDIAMLPTTIDELAETMDSWICLRCGAPLDTEQVETLGKRTPIRCKYCSHTLTLGLYLM
jgi:DNA-directed RNA polymerase subunit RPC12/RpoP